MLIFVSALSPVQLSLVPHISVAPILAMMGDVGLSRYELIWRMSSIKKHFFIVLGIATVFMVILMFVNIKQRSLQSACVAAEHLRFDSFRLASRLKHSSDELTRMARIYVQTGDPKYEGYFNDILDIRNGKRTRPYHDML